MPNLSRIPPPWVERRYRKRPDFGRDLQLLDRRLRVLHGSTFGAASPCRTLSPHERASVEQHMRADGKL